MACGKHVMPDIPANLLDGLLRAVAEGDPKAENVEQKEGPAGKFTVTVTYPPCLDEEPEAKPADKPKAKPAEKPKAKPAHKPKAKP